MRPLSPQPSIACLSIVIKRELFVAHPLQRLVFGASQLLLGQFLRSSLQDVLAVSGAKLLGSMYHGLGNALQRMVAALDGDELIILVLALLHAGVLGSVARLTGVVVHHACPMLHGDVAPGK